ncbi:hypothetical protein H7J87_10155 [Mycolicibacterium wolinskyi]|uniref:Uncharacterized protein n=1 Tax=Mycolicibacterium wolinskyi TaxID=59750 RepID=A0A1X2FAZ1_9MYCO|nr:MULTISPECIES: hypothetical protein [Mycolicibacterium]MCV7285692.1 hypothetical protein [Mycolicibacterium wolinskyi]MCV7291277.1 hypothetical protein [Mycolicibacterium goodii]ORX15612.1 hypothetical protein AWC31_23975 [Mycolicibacterium wolinskyi]
MHKHVGIVVAATGLALAPVAVAPTAAAEICAGAHGRFVGVEGCGAPIAHIATGAAIAGGVAAGAAVESSAVPYFPGEIPCHTVEGVPYYTPPGQPC